jgi:hypothetical protein
VNYGGNIGVNWGVNYGREFIVLILNIQNGGSGGKKMGMEAYIPCLH